MRDLAAGYGRDPASVQLFVRANVRLTDHPLGRKRPAYHGSIEQIIEDLDATRRTGAHEVIIELQGSANGVDELLNLAATLTHPILSAV